MKKRDDGTTTGWWKSDDEDSAGKYLHPEGQILKFKAERRILSDKWSHLMANLETRDNGQVTDLVDAINSHDMRCLRWHQEYPDLGFNELLALGGVNVPQHDDDAT